MTSFFQLVKQSWKITFRNKQTFFILFLLLGGITLLMQSTLFSMGYNISDRASMDALFQDFQGLTIFLIFAFIGIIAAFFGIIGLTKMYTGKKVKILDILSEWKKIFPYIVTLLCLGLYYVAFFIALMILLGIGVVAFFVGVVVYSHIVSLPYNIGVALGALGFVFILLALIFVVLVLVWLLTSYYVFALPAFFLDDKKFFSAMNTSKNVISGRWLKTAGIFFLYVACILLIYSLTAFTQISLSPESILSLLVMMLQTSFQTIVGIFFYVFLFALYDDYKKHPCLKKKK